MNSVLRASGDKLNSRSVTARWNTGLTELSSASGHSASDVSDRCLRCSGPLCYRPDSEDTASGHLHRRIRSQQSKRNGFVITLYDTQGSHPISSPLSCGPAPFSPQISPLPRPVTPPYVVTDRALTLITVVTMLLRPLRHHHLRTLALASPHHSRASPAHSSTTLTPSSPCRALALPPHSARRCHRRRSIFTESCCRPSLVRRCHMHSLSGLSHCSGVPLADFIFTLVP